MKNFLKTFLAALLANVVGSGCVVFFIFAGLISLVGSIAMMGPNISGSQNVPVELKAGTILKIDLSSLSDIVSEDPMAAFSLKKAPRPISLSEALRAIRIAKNNPNISALYLNVEGIQGGLASVDALRRALEDFKQSKKPIFAYGDMYSQKAYYLSSVADRILLNPEGGVSLTGIASGTMMYKDALDKLGLKMEVFKVGTFKSAVEPYILNEMSEANKLQVKEYIDGLWASITGGISQARKIPTDSLQAFVNRGGAFESAKAFVESKLVDTLMYRADVGQYIAKRLGKKAKELRMVSLADMADQDDPSASTSGDAVRVIFAEGEIVSEELSDFGGTGSTIGYKLVDELGEAAEDEDVKAVVLRVNSPGGSAFLSEQIWHAVKQLRAKKPVVVSMGDAAASGGYYIASPANMIVAEANTITGSIGIFGMIPNASELAKRFGVNMDIVKTSEYADLEVGIPFRPMTDEQRALIQRQIERGYDTFLGRVAEGRRMTKAQVDSVAQGRVWLGSKALQLGLVDKIGGLDTAIKESAKLAKLNEYHVHYGETSRSFWMEILESQTPTDEFIARVRYALLTSEERSALRFVQGQTRYAGIQARLPYELSLY
ncbi:MAG: signal peptide peptidase SppA [Porphyromonas sp.]|nr:signal peptide peptidase SppA [Porphyromonas sp.]